MEAILFQSHFLSSTVSRLPPKSNIRRSSFRYIRNLHFVLIYIREMQIRDPDPNPAPRLIGSLCIYGTLGWILDSQAAQRDTADTVAIGLKSDLVVGHRG